MKLTHWLAVAATAALVAACGSTTQGGAVGANRSQILIVSEAMMDEQAKLAYAETLQKASSARTLNINTAQTARVKNIASRLIAQTGHFRQDALRWDWQVNVIQEKTINAWCMPGGKIAVYSGIIDTLRLTDDELAAVIGHEISHALREHSREQASANALQNLGISAISQVAGLGDVGSTVVNTAAKYALSLPFSRNHETEADLMGLELMARAGYNPQAAVSVWQKMSAASGGSVPQFMSTHPSHATRIADLQAAMPKVLPLYQNAARGGARTKSAPAQKTQSGVRSFNTPIGQPRR